MATQASGKTSASEDVLRAIYGPKGANKANEYDQSLSNWWKEYAARKNDEEDEHVADSLMYDERSTLPRMAQRPEIIDDDTAKKHLDELQQTQVQAMQAVRQEQLDALQKEIIEPKSLHHTGVGAPGQQEQLDALAAQLGEKHGS